MSLKKMNRDERVNIRWYAIGIDLGGTNIRMGAVSENRLISPVFTMPTRAWEGPDIILKRIVDRIDTFRRKVFPSDSLAGVGLGAPGPLDMSTGHVYEMPNLKGWKNFPLQKTLMKMTGADVVIMNDADALAYGEYLTGAARGVPFFVLISLGSGIGSSIFINGQPWTGISGISAELGHIQVSQARIKCGCGRYGHLESFLSSRNMIRRIVHHIGKGAVTDINMSELSIEGHQIKEIIRAGRRKDALALKEMQRYGIYLGKAFATIVNLLNPPLIVLTGGVSKGWDLFGQYAVGEMKNCAFKIQSDAVDIRVSKLQEKAGVLGCGLIALERKALVSL